MRLMGGPTTLAPRLLLLFALVACVLGFGQFGATASSDGTDTAPTVAVATAHAGHHSPTTAPSAADASPAVPHGTQDEHGGHGAHGDHAVSCMATTGGAAQGDLVAPATTTAIGSLVVAPASQFRFAAPTPAYPRPPDIATLCVQRI